MLGSIFNNECQQKLSNENADAAGGLGLLLSLTREETGLDDDGLGGETTLAEDLEEATLGDVNDGGDGGILGGVETGLLRHEAPQLLDVHRAAVAWVVVLVEVAHTDLTEVTGMVLVKVDTVMMLTTGKTATSAVTTFSVLANTTLAMTDLAAHLAGLLHASRHFLPIWLIC